MEVPKPFYLYSNQNQRYFQLWGWVCLCFVGKEEGKKAFITLISKVTKMLQLPCCMSLWDNLLSCVWYFVTKIVLTYWRKKMFYWPRICKIFEITRNSPFNGKVKRQLMFLIYVDFFLTKFVMYLTLKIYVKTYKNLHLGFSGRNFFVGRLLGLLY